MSEEWKFDWQSFVFGMALMTILAIIITLLSSHEGPKEKFLTDAEILSQTDVCNHEGRLAVATYDNDGRIIKVFCGLPPYTDKRDYHGY